MLLPPLYFKAVGGTKKFFKAMERDMDMKVSISLDFQFQQEFIWENFDQWTDGCHQMRSLLLDALVHSVETTFLKVTIYSNNFIYWPIMKWK